MGSLCLCIFFHMYHMYHINRAEFPDRKSSCHSTFSHEKGGKPHGLPQPTTAHVTVDALGQDVAEVFGFETFEVGGSQKVTVSRSCLLGGPLWWLVCWTW